MEAYSAHIYYANVTLFLFSRSSVLSPVVNTLGILTTGILSLVWTALNAELISLLNAGGPFSLDNLPCLLLWTTE